MEEFYEEEKEQIQLDKIEITYSDDNTHIQNSYLITTRNAISSEVDYIMKYREATKRPITRTLNSYVREWKAHNRLYYWNINKDNKWSKEIVEHAKDCDLEENQSKFWAIVYLILGGV